MSIFSDAIQSHLDTLLAAAGVEITYSRGDNSVTITAVPGQQPFEAIDQNGVVVESIAQTFVFKQSDLVLGGSAATPQRNDLITRTVNGQTAQYRVLVDYGSPHYRDTDGFGVGFRVFAKRV